MTSTAAPTADAPCATNHLRCLIVDDNSLNLAILSMMLKRRFSHVLDGPPIAVDGGLKAIQALRQEVFDCVLLDIQMPHISGIDVCKRIRAGSDGILEANRNVIILATTTAVGPAPSALYRSVGMNGVLPKPVRPAHLASFLGPLVRSLTVALVPRGDGSMVRAPQQSAILDSFFMPDSDDADRLSAMSRPDICDGGNFEGALAEQTRASLKRVGAAGRASTISSASGSGPRVRPTALRIKSNGSASSAGASSGEELPSRAVSAFSEPHRRGNSVSISSRTLKDQLAREVAQMEALEPPSELSDGETSDAAVPLVAPVSTTAAALLDTPIAFLSPTEAALPLRAAKSSPIPSPTSPAPIRIRRPLVHHRASSPAWLARWESAIEAPDMSYDVALSAASAGKGASVDVDSSSIDSPVSRPHSAPTSPTIGPPQTSVASPVRPKLPRPRLRTEASDDGSGSGSVSGNSAATNVSSLSTAWSSFSLRTPSEEERAGAGAYFDQMSRNSSPERRRSSACTMATSTDTSLASSPRSECPPPLPLMSTNGLLNPEDNFTKPTSTLLHKLALPVKVVIVSEEESF